jgi:hypothetical protein
MNEADPKFDKENPLKPYLDAKENGTLPKYYLNRFKYFRDDWLNDLPSINVHLLATLDREGKFVGDDYKCRWNYIVGLSLTLETAVEDSVIADSELVKKIGNFRHYDFKFLHNEFTTKEEIDMINQILADMIQYLEGK